LGNRKDIWPVKNPTTAFPKGSPLETFGGSGLTWKNKPVNENLVLFPADTETSTATKGV